MNRFLLYLLLCFCLTWNSCKKENACDCLKGAGNTISKEVSLNAFHALHVEDKINVTIKIDSVYKVIIKTGKNLMPLISYEIKDDMLYLIDKNKCNWMRSYDNHIEVELHVPYLKDIEHWGAGIISSLDTIQVYEFNLNIHNSGDVHLIINSVLSHCNAHETSGDIYIKGVSRESYIFNSGNGYVYAGELQSADTFMNNASTGNCYVSVSTWLVADINAAGNIYYAGNPIKIDKKIMGTGMLIKY